MERPRGQQRVYSEFEQLAGRSRRFMLRVISQDFLYHETPVAMSSVVWMNLRRIVMRPHVQRMLHNLAVRSPERVHRLSLLFSGPNRKSYSLCCAAVSRDQHCGSNLSSGSGWSEVSSTGCSLSLRVCGSSEAFFYALPLSRSGPMWSRNLEPRANFWPKTHKSSRAHAQSVCVNPEFGAICQERSSSPWQWVEE